MLYIDSRGVCDGIALTFFWKSVFEKHPSVQEWNQMCVVPPCFLNVGGQIHLSSINDVKNFPGGIGGFEKRMQLCLPLSWTAAPFSPEKGIVCHSCRCRVDPQCVRVDVWLLGVLHIVRRWGQIHGVCFGGSGWPGGSWCPGGEDQGILKGNCSIRRRAWELK